MNHFLFSCTNWLYNQPFNFFQYDTNNFLIRYLKLRTDENTKTMCIEREVLEKQKIKDIHKGDYTKIVNEMILMLERLLKE